MKEKLFEIMINFFIWYFEWGWIVCVALGILSAAWIATEAFRFYREEIKERLKNGKHK